MSEWSELDVEVGDGVALHAYRRGAGPSSSSPTACSTTPTRWTRVADALEADHDVVAYDARYHGLTREPDGAPWAAPPTSSPLADALGLDRPVAMGHSMGAVTVAQAVAAHPDRFRAAVLEDPAWRGGPLDAGMVESGRGRVRRDARGHRRPRSRRWVASSAPGWDDAEYAPWARSKTRFHGVDRMADASGRCSDRRGGRTRRVADGPGAARVR